VVEAAVQEVVVMEASVVAVETLTLIPMVKMVAMAIKHQVTETGQVAVAVV
jgi:hypothetical protein